MYWSACVADQREALETGQSSDPTVDPVGQLTSVGIAEQVPDQIRGFGLRHHPGPHGPPRPAQREAHEALGGRMLQAAFGLADVEVDVAPLLLGDAAQQLGEHRVFRFRGQPHVGGLGGPFVDGTPRQRALRRNGR